MSNKRKKPMRGLETEMKVVRPGLCCLETNILIHLGLLKLLPIGHAEFSPTSSSLW